MDIKELERLHKELLLEWYTTEKHLMTRNDCYSYTNEGLKAKLKYYDEGFKKCLNDKDNINNGLYRQQKFI